MARKKRRKRATGRNQRTTYKKKSVAKKAKPKGASIYKVKGGYRISKTRLRKKAKRKLKKRRKVKRTRRRFP